MSSKVLIIEDEPDIRTYLTAVLEDHGFEAQAMDGQDVEVAEVAAVRPDLIILDVMMPKRSGVSIYKELRTCSDLKNVAVAIFSGFTPESGALPNGVGRMLQEHNIAPPDGFVEKPFALEAFIAMVHRLIEKTKEPDEDQRP